MIKITRLVLLVVLLAGLAALVMVGAGPVGNAAGSAEEAESGGSRNALLAQVAETPTPLPTLVFDDEPSPPGALWGVGLMLVCAMMGLLVFGILAATLLVRLRQRIKN